MWCSTSNPVAILKYNDNLLSIHCVHTFQYSCAFGNFSLQVYSKLSENANHWNHSYFHQYIIVREQYLINRITEMKKKGYVDLYVVFQCVSRQHLGDLQWQIIDSILFITQYLGFWLYPTIPEKNTIMVTFLYKLYIFGVHLLNHIQISLIMNSVVTKVCMSRKDLEHTNRWDRGENMNGTSFFW